MATKGILDTRLHHFAESLKYHWSPRAFGRTAASHLTHSLFGKASFGHAFMDELFKEKHGKRGVKTGTHTGTSTNISLVKALTQSNKTMSMGLLELKGSIDQLRVDQKQSFNSLEGRLIDILSENKVQTSVLAKGLNVNKGHLAIAKQAYATQAASEKRKLTQDKHDQRFEKQKEKSQSSIKQSFEPLTKNITKPSTLGKISKFMQFVFGGMQGITAWNTWQTKSNIKQTDADFRKVGEKLGVKFDDETSHLGNFSVLKSKLQQGSLSKHLSTQEKGFFIKEEMKNSFLTKIKDPLNTSQYSFNYKPSNIGANSNTSNRIKFSSIRSLDENNKRINFTKITDQPDIPHLGNISDLKRKLRGEEIEKKQTPSLFKTISKSVVTGLTAGFSIFSKVISKSIEKRKQLKENFLTVAQKEQTEIDGHDNELGLEAPEKKKSLLSKIWGVLDKGLGGILKVIIGALVIGLVTILGKKAIKAGMRDYNQTGDIISAVGAASKEFGTQLKDSIIKGIMEGILGGNPDDFMKYWFPSKEEKNKTDFQYEDMRKAIIDSTDSPWSKYMLNSANPSKLTLTQKVEYNKLKSTIDNNKESTKIQFPQQPSQIITNAPVTNNNTVIDARPMSTRPNMPVHVSP